MKRLLAIFAALVVTVVIVRTVKKPPVVEPLIAYPRSATYAWMRGNGSPLVLAGVIDTAAVRSLARYDVVSIDAYRTGTNADALRLLKSLNPRTTMLAFHKTGRFFVCGPGNVYVPGCDTTVANAPWSRFTVIRKHDAVIYGTDGPFNLYGGGWVDFSRPGFAEEYADTIAAWAGANGVFLDELCLGMGGPEALGDTINFKRAGFFDFRSWNSADSAGVERFLARLRVHLGEKLICTNCGPNGSRRASGHMVENYPYQQGGSVAAYLARESTYTAPRLNWLSAWAVNGNPADPENVRKARYALGVACMGSGVGVLTWSPTDVARGAFMWLPEYEPRGWLGQPQGAATRIARGYRRIFAGGSVAVDTVAQTATFVRGRP